MSMELIAIISTAVALAGLILNGQRTQRVEMQAQREETKTEFKAVREDMQAQREAIISLLERMAHLEGLLEGLREAITGRRVAEETGKYNTR
ncbi:MAG: hypothetical protein OXE42_03685 [Gammaproteobacteria bacterium]|nr:hypothetical protein [Gammaproteobacteria bacterium]